jgi:3-methyl-2-oxobutanoate hydroxymethyltransferase
MNARPRVTVQTLREMKRAGSRIVVLTAYDHPTALIEDRCGVDVILVGDSLGMAVLGYENTLPVTIDEVLHHARAVARARPRALTVGDMPFMTYQSGVVDAVRNAGRLVKEGGMQAVKLEGGRRMEPAIRAIVDAAIPVMGHLGLTPQSVHEFGGYRVQGRDPLVADQLLEEAAFLEACGCFAIVLEGIPWPLAQRITQAISIPTIGIGAGVHCSGQVQVIHDLLGMFDDFTPKHTKRYANIGAQIRDAIGKYVDEVKNGDFPGDDQTFQ